MFLKPARPKTYGGSQMSRRQQGQALVEAVVAVGLSGFFVLVLSGMLSQTLVTSTTSQNELIAANAAELLLENARTITYAEYDQLISSGTISLNSPIQFQVNLTGNGDPTAPQIRLVPVQLNLTDPAAPIGAVNPLTGLFNNANAWSGASGNYFKGLAQEIVSPVTLNGGLGYQIAIKILYNSGQGQALTKQTNRIAYVMRYGASTP